SSAQGSLYYRLANMLAAADRTPGPSQLYEVSISAQRRWHEQAQNLKDKKQYRPGTLRHVKAILDAQDPARFGLGANAIGNADYGLYQVKLGDGLRAIARDRLGDANRADEIFRINLDKLDSPDRIYPGQILRLPKEAT